MLNKVKISAIHWQTTVASSWQLSSLAFLVTVKLFFAICRMLLYLLPRLRMRIRVKMKPKLLSRRQSSFCPWMNFLMIWTLLKMLTRIDYSQLWTNYGHTWLSVLRTRSRWCSFFTSDIFASCKLLFSWYLLLWFSRINAYMKCLLFSFLNYITLQW